MTDMSQQLGGKVVLVTGAAGGIGRALVRMLRERGARVAALDVAAPSFDDGGDAVLPLACDISDESACADAVAACLGHFGRVDGLINNAAVGMNRIRVDYETRPFALEEIEPAFWRQIMAVNATGTFLMIRAVMPHFRTRGSGRIISVTTSFFTMLRRGWGPYAASKAAVEAASAGWAAELEGTGITVNILVPGGPTDTPMVPPESFPDRAGLIRPEAMAPPACWLLSDDASDVTGRRFVAAKWDAELPPREAAEAAGAPIGWPDLAAATVVWPGAPETP